MKLQIALLCLLSISAFSDEAILLQRIVALETRIAQLEEKLAPVLEEERVKEVAKQQKELARERIMMDAEFLSRLDLNLIEKAYYTANQDWKSEEAQKALSLLTEKYPKANRTGCAVLAMAQVKEGREQIRLLRIAIQDYGTSYYASGVNVGAYARLYLGMRSKKEGDNDAAALLFDELETDYPDAVDHKGQLLTSHIKGLE